MHFLNERALMARLNRALAAKGERIHASRHGSRCFDALGRYYVLNDRNVVVRSHVDVEDLGRDMGVLGHTERLKAE